MIERRGKPDMESGGLHPAARRVGDQPFGNSRAMKVAAKMALVMTPLMLAPRACGKHDDTDH